MTKHDPTNDMLSMRADALALIENWESKIRILFQDYANTLSGDDDPEEEVIPELLQEQLQDQLESFREELFERLKAHFADATRDVPSKTYEQVVYSLISDRMRRYYGYYEAINRAAAEAAALNNQVGDLVFEVDKKKLTDLLSSIDEIYFVKYLCTGLGLDPELTAKIVNYQVDREFKPKSK